MTIWVYLSVQEQRLKAARPGQTTEIQHSWEVLKIKNLHSVVALNIY